MELLGQVWSVFLAVAAKLTHWVEVLVGPIYEGIAGLILAFLKLLLSIGKTLLTLL